MESALFWLCWHMGNFFHVYKWRLVKSWIWCNFLLDLSCWSVDTSLHNPKNIRFTTIKCPCLQCDDSLTKCVGVFHQVPLFSQSVTPVSILHCITLRIFDFRQADIEVLGLIPDIDVLRLIPLWSGPLIYHTPLLILLMHWYLSLVQRHPPLVFTVLWICHTCQCTLQNGEHSHWSSWCTGNLSHFSSAGYWGSWIDSLIK